MINALRAIDDATFDGYEDRGVYFARYRGTAQQLAERVGFSEEHGAQAGIVIEVGRNYGFAKGDLWHWLDPR